MDMTQMERPKGPDLATESDVAMPSGGAASKLTAEMLESTPDKWKAQGLAALWVDRTILMTGSQSPSASRTSAMKALRAIENCIRQPEYDLSNKDLIKTTGRMLEGAKGTDHILELLTRSKQEGTKARLFLDVAKLDEAIGKQPNLELDLATLLDFHRSKVSAQTKSTSPKFGGDRTRT
jgi:hypothetical protein